MAIEKFETINGFVQVPLKEFKRMRALLEDRADGLAYDKAMARDEEAFPAGFARKLFEGSESRVKLYRMYRGLSQTELGNAVGCGRSMISQIEASKTQGSLSLMKKIAQTLGVDLDDLI